MRIFVSPEMISGFIPVYDHAPAPKITDDGMYMLLFETGKVTMRVLKQLYLDDRDAYLCVRNMEYFIQQLGPLRNIEIRAMDEQRHRAKRGAAVRPEAAMREKYAGVESGIRRMLCGEADAADEGEAGRGIEISFAPRMFDSVRTSLREPAVYRSEPLACHRLFSHLESGQSTYEELGEILDRETLDETLKSMIFGGIVRQKDGSFYISDTLDG